MAKLKRKVKSSISKREIWFFHYTNVDDRETFMNSTESAIAARYHCKDRASFASIGAANFKAMCPKIGKWLDEMGLSEEALKLKLLSLLSAKKTKFFAHQGVVMDEREVEALDIQTKALNMALKVRGTGNYSTQKHEMSGPGGGPIPTASVTITSEMSEKEAAELYARMIKGK